MTTDSRTGVLERWLLPMVIWSLALVAIAFAVQAGRAAARIAGVFAKIGVPSAVELGRG